MGYRGLCEWCRGDLISIETEEEWNFINSEIRNRRLLEWWKKERRVDLGEWKATDYQQMERKPAKRKQ